MSENKKIVRKTFTTMSCKEINASRLITVKDPKLQPFKVSVTHQLTEVDHTSVCTKKYIVICTISENSRIGLRRLDCSAFYIVSNLKTKMKK